jgi:DNA-directed RNA polymerase specialized sigma subunit
MEKLQKFRINFSLISFLHKQPHVADDAKLVGLYNEIMDLRQIIAQTNLPLVLSRSRLFWKKTPRSHLEYMDIVQIAIEGLLTAIDKYVPPFSRVFRSVIIGRVTGSLIADYSQTMLHFFPSDRKTIYRANKARRHSDDIEHITNEINNQEPTNGKQRTIGEVKEILSASSHISIFAHKDDDDGEVMHQYEASNDYRPDVQVEEFEATTKAMTAVNSLPLFEQKLLKMKFGL